MIRNIILISLLLYLISCTSSDNSAARIAIPNPPKSVKTSIPKPNVEAIKAFSGFLDDLASYQFVPSGEKEKHESVKAYLPDSTISEGFDLHIHEIGRIDTFRLIFHEYFDIYDDWSKTYLDVFNSEGKALDNKQLWELSFEGNISINIIHNKILEIAYHDFFQEEDLLNKALIPAQSFYLSPSNKVQQRLEGTIYEYYQINPQGQFESLTQNRSVDKTRYFPQSSAKLLSKSEILQYDLDEVHLMRDELLASHGYIFEDIPTRSYFEMQNWYYPVHQEIDSLLSDIERLNLELLQKVEREY